MNKPTKKSGNNFVKISGLFIKNTLIKTPLYEHEKQPKTLSYDFSIKLT